MGLKSGSYPDSAGIVARTRYVSIIFVTGVSGAGKTTLYEGLRKDPELAYVEFHEIDEDGIPAAGTGPWRQFRVELLLHEAVVRERRDGVSTVICGVTKPHEVIESGSYPVDIPVHFVLVQVPHEAIRKRLEARLASWSSEDVEGAVQRNRMLSSVMYRSVAAQRNGVIVEASRLSRVKVRGLVKHLIKELAVPSSHVD